MRLNRGVGNTLSTPVKLHEAVAVSHDDGYEQATQKIHVEARVYFLVAGWAEES